MILRRPTAFRRPATTPPQGEPSEVALVDLGAFDLSAWASLLDLGPEGAEDPAVRNVFLDTSSRILAGKFPGGVSFLSAGQEFSVLRNLLSPQCVQQCSA